MSNTTSANEIQQISPGEAASNIVLHHLSSFQNNDLESVLSDYTHESVLITPSATYTGIKEIMGFFAELVVHFPKGESTIELDKIVSNGNMVYIVWHAETPSLHVVIGSDTFIIKENKIYQQTFVGQLKFK